RKSSVSGFNIIVFMIAIVFFLWSMFAFANMLWNFGTDWVGFVWLGLSMVTFFGQIGFINTRKKSKMVFHEITLNPNASIEEIAYNTGVPLNLVKKVIVDLKMRGILQSSFNTQTGHMENDHLVSTIPSTSPRPIAASILTKPSIENYSTQVEIEFPKEKPRYCSYCGNALNPGVSKYCEFCGQAI
ncbi:MAG: hypothetical protein ACFFDY_13585, partial [Candidatus Thorarchaeota archaeon]